MPGLREDLRVVEECTADGEIESGRSSAAMDARFLIERFVPRFVSSDDYADAFALEWNEFRTAHLDSYTGLMRLDAEFRSFLDFPIERPEGEAHARRRLRSGAGSAKSSSVTGGISSPWP